MLDDNVGQGDFYAGAKVALETGIRAVADRRANPEGYSSWDKG
jgi:hypothetical protein